MTVKKTQERDHRLREVNAFIRVVGSCGRRFFYRKVAGSMNGDAGVRDSGERWCRITADERGRLWWHDDWSWNPQYLHYAGRWKNFSHGGTLKVLVQHLARFIQTGKKLPKGILGPWPEWICEGDPWGYGDDMQQVRDAAKLCDLLEEEKTT